jgi:hypothetical protein
VAKDWGKNPLKTPGQENFMAFISGVLLILIVSQSLLNNRLLYLGFF